MAPFSALLIGRGKTLAWSLPPVLARAGFVVDVITSSRVMRHSKFVRQCEVVRGCDSLLPAIARKLESAYDWISITEDQTLAEILQSDWPVEKKLKVLPVQKPEHLRHLYSKIGLSETFAAQGVNTPPFSAIHNRAEAIAAARDLGVPVLLKVDASGGGRGVFECTTLADIEKIPSSWFQRPLLMQKKILGVELDLSTLYFEGTLIHFSHAQIEKVCENRFGPSSLRTYRPLSAVEPRVFEELAQIGKALGAHGFTNMGCIQQPDGRRFYFEADMRANVWFPIPYFFGDDPALRIRDWFTQKKTLQYPVPALPNQPTSLLVPYFLRLKPWELLCNRYRVWKFIPKEPLGMVIYMILCRFLFLLQFQRSLIAGIKWILPKRCHKSARTIAHRLGCIHI